MGQQAYSRSKQNSEAFGMLYQWGRKDPFTYATNSFKVGALDYQYGKYPVKIYNGKRELIYQEDIGGGNSGKSPVGGVIYPNRIANSMMETIKKPNVFYGSNSAVISQSRHSKELWDYYSTSYSRGTDGKSHPGKYPSWHNTYLDGYIVLRSKSIYDPCPYGYRTLTNGTYKDFNSNSGWTAYSYDGGNTWSDNWFSAKGGRGPIAVYEYVGMMYWLTTSTIASNSNQYLLQRSNNSIVIRPDWAQSRAMTIRCIEDATVKADES